jgi:hypothetical protein
MKVFQGTRLFILGTAPKNRELLRHGGCCHACVLLTDHNLLFYLPIIIFEAMLETNANKRKAGEPTVTPDRQNLGAQRVATRLSHSR